MSEKWTPKALLAYLKLKLDNDFLLQNIQVVGEISNFNHHNRRHMYFTLKDSDTRISCVMFFMHASKVDFEIENGMEVILTADVSIFEASGSLQLYVKEIKQAGIGDLALKFEQLKTKLKKAGLFESGHKKTFKRYPNKIAVISGKDSAALNDIITTLKRRWPYATVSVYPSLVQGSSAHLDIIKNLKAVDKQDYDAIILARGGGSIEDLWAFNEEELAYTIFDLKTPIVSGVGHEIDFTIADFVSDLRAPTPTAAAELITPHQDDLKLLLNNFRNTFIERIVNINNLNQQKVDFYANRPIFLHPDLLTSKYKERLVKYSKELSQFQERQLKTFNNFKHLRNDFMKNINQFIYTEKLKLNNLNNSLHNAINNYNKDLRNNFSKQLQLIESYSPINTLKRGYSMIEVNNKVVSSVKHLNIDAEIAIKLHDGKVKAKITAKEQNNGEIWFWSSN